jgi:hypothetical protein
MNDTLLFLANELHLHKRQHVGLIRCVSDMPPAQQKLYPSMV